MARPSLTAAQYAYSFWSRVDVRGDDECWPWLASCQPSGYGQVRISGRLWLAHRLAYTLAAGPIPKGLTIDHVRARGCIRRDCCNPGHLEAVTLAENKRRGDGVAAANARKTHCKHGHPFSGSNLTVIYRKDGRVERRCRVCELDRHHRYYQRRRYGVAA